MMPAPIAKSRKKNAAARSISLGSITGYAGRRLAKLIFAISKCV